MKPALTDCEEYEGGMKRIANSFLMFVVDTLLLIDSMMVLVFLKHDITGYLKPLYIHFYIGFVLLWVLFFALSDKHRVFFQPGRIVSKLWVIAKTSFFILMCLLIYFIGFRIRNISRGILFGSFLITVCAEIILMLILHKKTTSSEYSDGAFRPGFLQFLRVSQLDLVSLDILIFFLSFLFMAWLKPATLHHVIPRYWRPFLIMTATWVILSYINQKYTLANKRKLAQVLSVLLYADFFIAGATAVVVFLFHLFFLSRIMLFGTMAMTFVIESITAVLMFYTREFIQFNPSFADTSFISRSRALEEESETLPQPPPHPMHIEPEYYQPGFRTGDDGESVQETLYDLITENTDLISFIEHHVNIDQIHLERSMLLNTATLFNLRGHKSQSQEMLMNLHKENDFRRVNASLIEVNRLLMPGGVYIGCGETIQERLRNLIDHFSPVLGYPIYVVDFIFNRIFPKLKLTQGLYFSITKGRNRPLSKCEILGRLYFCGFRVVAEREINGRLYFIAVKTGLPREDTNPSYGPLFRMKRTGKDEKTIYVYKLRTMHPYAEYLQHYLVEKHGYGDKGKILDDFRVTYWGQHIRNVWLDELPQLLNLVKGELSLVGVRPLSDRFLKEYTPEQRKERHRYKPGCIPPYVALRMQKVEEYIKSEQIYLAEKRKHPILTDIKFFIMAVFNILTRRIRSE